MMPPEQPHYDQAAILCGALITCAMIALVGWGLA